MQTHLVQEAMRLASLGYRVFPCVPNQKRPLTPRGLHEGTTDEDQIADWWTLYPDANIGLVTDGLVVVDVDATQDGKPNPWLSSLGPLQDLHTSAKATSPRGGMHFFFRQPATSEFRNTASKIAPGVDTRANGGYVLVAPSQTDAGRYTWLHGGVLDVERESLPILPKWLEDTLQIESRQPLAHSMGDAGQIISGSRNDTLARHAGNMRRGNMDKDEILAALLKMNERRCRPPLSEREVEKIAESVSRYEPDQVMEAVLNDSPEVSEDDYQDAQITDPGFLPASLLSPPGFLRDIIAWNLETAYKPQKELALAGAISLLSALTGRKVQDETGTRSNLYVIGVAASGSGKDHARKINKTVLSRYLQSGILGPESAASYQGIVKWLEQSPATLFQFDEFGRYLESITKSDNGPQAQIVTMLMKLYSSADSAFVPEARADLKSVVTINQPHCVIYATTVADSLFGSMTADNINDGFMGRLMVIESSNDDPDPRDAMQIGECPRDIAYQADQWVHFSPGGNLSSVNPVPVTLAYEPEAKRRYKILEALCRSEANEHPVYRGLWTRATEKARKLGLLYQCSIGSVSASKVSLEAADWACEVMERLTRRMVYLADLWVVRGLRERNAKTILRMIRDSPDGMSKSQLTRRTQNIDRHTRDDILKDLIESGQVEKKQMSSTTRTGTYYKICTR
jgi:hypothetical protein